MKSIRLFLVVALIASITLLNFLTALRGYQESMREAQEIFDGQLLATANLLASTTNASRNTSDTLTSIQEDRNVSLEEKQEMPTNQPNHSVIAFQVWQQDGIQSSIDDKGAPLELIHHSANAPATLITSLDNGFDEANFNGYRWRTFTLYQAAQQRWIITAERNDIRYQLAEKVITASILPTVVVIPLVGLMIWLIVGFGLRPVKQLAAELAQKEAKDLTPIAKEDIPLELLPLTDSANDLLTRLQASFDREKRFASDAAHELRTPISALKIHYQNLLAEFKGNSNTIDNLGAGITRMEHLIEQILMLNRTTPEQYMANFERLDLYALAQTVISEDYREIAGKELQFELQGEPGFIMGDRFAIHTLIHNLLSNAIKYTPANGEIIIRLRKNAANDEQGRQLTLEVMDSGPGIPAAQRYRVFERFYRIGGDQHASKTLGCGLGLAIVKHIVDLHNAHIKLDESTLNHGLLVAVQFSIDGGV